MHYTYALGKLHHVDHYMASFTDEIPSNREHKDRSLYLKLVALMGHYIHGVYLFME